MSLREKAMGMNSGQGISFMEGRSKGDVKSLNDIIITVKDYAFLTGDDGEYLVFIIEGDEGHFYFGASVMTDNFKEFTAEDKAELQKEGLPVRLSEKKNKKGNRTYQACEFYPVPF